MKSTFTLPLSLTSYDTDEDNADEDEGGTVNNLNGHQLLADGEFVLSSKEGDLLRLVEKHNTLLEYSSASPTAIHSPNITSTSQCPQKKLKLTQKHLTSKIVMENSRRKE